MQLIEYIPSIVAVISIVLALWVVFFEKKKNPKIIDGEQITTDKTASGIVELTSYVNDFDPDYLVCLNRGGILIGSHISLLLQIPTENLLKCSIKREKLGNTTITNCDVSKVSGKVLILDSMIRTGDTFSLAIDYIKQHGDNISKIESVALVTKLDENDLPAFKQLSHHIYTTTDINMKFPWTKLKDVKSSERSKLLESEFNQVKDLTPQDIVKSILLPSLSVHT